MTKNEIMLGDLRGGLCSSGLCRQLRAVAADEIEGLTADNALAIESLARQQAEIQALQRKLAQVTNERDLLMQGLPHEPEGKPDQ